MFTAPKQSLRLSLPLVATLWCACGISDAELGTEGPPPDEELSSTEGQALVSCAARTDTGYSNGNAFAITVVTADGQPIELATANAYSLMQRAAEAAGVPLRVVSGFRTMAEQRYLYSCYVNCNCNACTLAASPGYSNHQSGHALDLNTAAGGVYNWLAANAGRFGFARTVPSEPWHWEYWGGGPGGGACATPPPCDRSAGGFTFSCDGPQPGMACVQLLETSDPHTWNDNYLCSNVNLGMRWSSAGPLAGMRCTQLLEGADPDTWNDNFICVPETSPYRFNWSSAGPIAGQVCVQLNEPADPHTWNDNYLCFDSSTIVRQSRGPFTFSSAGAVAGKSCVQLLEPSDPHTWSDNYFCSDTDLGMKWSSAGPIAGMSCTQIVEASDPDTWSDNYLCLPPGAPYTFSWSQAGPRSENCVAWYEGADPHTWNDNYLCW